MHKDNNNGGSIPLRWPAIIILALNCAVIAVLGITFLPTAGSFPTWFAPVFLAAISLLTAVVLFYMAQLVLAVKGPMPPSDRQTRWIWLLILMSVPCTLALHRFYPFRPDVIMYLSWLSPIGKHNVVLSVGCVVAVAALCVAYFRGKQRPAVTGLLILAAVMLVPNDDCGNYFNQPWINLFGASPVMFMPNSIVILIGYCGLHGIRPKLSAIFMLCINICVLALGIGHMTGVVW